MTPVVAAKRLARVINGTQTHVRYSRIPVRVEALVHDLGHVIAFGCKLSDVSRDLHDDVTAAFAARKGPLTDPATSDANELVTLVLEILVLEMLGFSFDRDVFIDWVEGDWRNSVTHVHKFDYIHLMFQCPGFRPLARRITRWIVRWGSVSDTKLRRRFRRF